MHPILLLLTLVARWPGVTVAQYWNKGVLQPPICFATTASVICRLRLWSKLEILILSFQSAIMYGNGLQGV